MAKRQSLGRGLNALIPDVSRETSTASSDVPTSQSPDETGNAGVESVVGNDISAPGQVLNG